MTNPFCTSLQIELCENAIDAIARGFDWSSATPKVHPIEVKKVIIVKDGTARGNPTADFLLEDSTGQQYVFMIMGNLLGSLPLRRAPSASNAGISLSDCVKFLQDTCHQASNNAGWWHDIHTGAPILQRPHVVGEKLMLIVSEVSEAMEGHRKGLQDDKLPHRQMIEVELADALIRIADLAGALGLDLGGAVAEKLAFNATRPDHKPEARMAEGGKAY